MFFVVLCPGTPEGSTGSGSGFKASQKTGQRLKVSSDRLGEAGNRTCDPWFTRHRFIPYTTAASDPIIASVWYNCSKVNIEKLDKLKIVCNSYESSYGEILTRTNLPTLERLRLRFSFYNTLVRPQLEYVAAVWDPHTKELPA